MVGDILVWNDLGLEDGGFVCVVPFDGVEDAIVPTRACEDTTRSKRHGS